MINLSEIGIEEYVRSIEKPNEFCSLKIKGLWQECRMVADEYGWLYVVLYINGIECQKSLLEIHIMLNGIV